MKALCTIPLLALAAMLAIPAQAQLGQFEIQDAKVASPTPPAGQPAQPGSVFTNDTIDKVNAQPGSIQGTPDVAAGQSSGYREGGVNEATASQQGVRRNQPGNRPRKSRRMRKP